NSPTIVLPEPVGAATSTPLPASSAWHASIWKGSRAKSYRSRKGASAVACSAARSRAAAYASAGERSSVILSSSLPAASDRGRDLYRDGGPGTRKRPGARRARPGRFNGVGSGDVVVAVDPAAGAAAVGLLGQGRRGDRLDLADVRGREVEVGGLVVGGAGLAGRAAPLVVEHRDTDGD